MASLAPVPVTCTAVCPVFTNNIETVQLQNRRAIKRSKIKRYSSAWVTYIRATGCRLSNGITQCYLPPDTGERDPPNQSQEYWYLIYLPGGMEG